MTFKVETIALSVLEGRLNAIADDGWTLVALNPHPFDTIDGEAEFVTVWIK